MVSAFLSVALLALLGERWWREPELMVIRRDERLIRSLGIVRAMRGLR